MGRSEKRGIGLFIPALIVVGIAILFSVSLPEKLFDDPFSTVVYDRNGDLIGARIASDGQWRFPPADSLPPKYMHALIQFEDRYFNWHPGVNLPSLFRALYLNIREGEVVSGGSTLTMQVMRMSRKNRRRTLWQKGIESWMALRYELTATKEDILINYASHAPFGGNVVGLETASWRYFGTGASNLSWAESALLAILPNSPAMIHPGRNRSLLKEKRDRLLVGLRDRGYLDSLTCQLAIAEPLPGPPLPLPDLAPHLTDHFLVFHPGEKQNTSIQPEIQKRSMELATIHGERLKRNQVNNLACLIVEIETGEVLAYVGNVSDQKNRHENRVDVIQSSRSTGSILKPILYAAMLDQGLLLPGTLVPDVPLQFDGYAPKNFHRGYEGAVPAYKALERSLNVPSVVMLQQFGVDPFLNLLDNLGFTTFPHSQEYYGLSLILGGGECSLWELAGVYSSLARTLNHYNMYQGSYLSGDMHMPVLEPGGIRNEHQTMGKQGIIHAGSIYLTFESMLEVSRPDELSSWYLMNTTSPIAWKTGTSYGFRDAWSVGITPEYMVAVWAGNADGEGRTGLTGLASAAPLMFDLFDLLPATSWFDKPLDDLREIEVCSSSGHLPGPFCAELVTIESTGTGLNSSVCPYHTRIHLNLEGSFRVNSSCVAMDKIRSESWFVLPPQMEWYYKRKDPSYRELPPIMEGCSDQANRVMEVVYPRRGSRVVIPRELDGTRGSLVMEVAHRLPGSQIYWHLNDTYLGTTVEFHRMEAIPEAGNYRLTVVDRNGQSESVQFEVVERSANE